MGQMMVMMKSWGEEEFVHQQQQISWWWWRAPCKTAQHWSQKPNAPKASASCVYHHGTNPQLVCTTAIRLQNYSPLCCIATCFTLLQYSQPIVYNTNSHNRAQKSFGFARYHCTVINRILQKKLQLFYIRLKHRKPSKQDTASIPQLCWSNSLRNVTSLQTDCFH